MTKIFDKRTVPGLEDFSSDSDDDNEIVFKKPRCDDDLEIELEVKNNEFLKEEPVENNIKQSNKMETLADNVVAFKRPNSIWGNIVQDEMLDESLKKCGVEKKNVKRAIESYTVNETQNKCNRKRNHNKPFSHRNNARSNEYPKKDKKPPIKDRVVIRTYNKMKNRNHINIDPSNPMQNINEMARILSEPKVDLLDKCYSILGLDKCLEFLYLTEDIEERGGLLIMDGSRRRSPGGVFLNLIKESPNISREDKNKIFLPDTFPRNNQQRPSYRNANTQLNGSIIEIQLVKPEVVMEIIEEQNKSEIIMKEEIKDDELEDGEIP